MMKTTEAKTLRSNHPSAQSSTVNRNKGRRAYQQRFIGGCFCNTHLQLDLVALNKIVGILVGVSAPNSANAGSIAKNSNPALTMANIATVDVRHRSFCCSFVLGITIKPG